jgi:glycosyltransferase involved in cell wall biosynthesis
MPSILHVGKYYYPYRGGIESVTASLARGASILGHNVSVVCFNNTLVENEQFIDGVYVFRSPISLLIASQPLGYKYFYKCLFMMDGADIVHLHTPNMLGAIAVLFIPKNKNLIVHWHSDVINKGIFGLLLRPLEYLLLRRADIIVATTAIYAEASRTLLPFINKTAIVPIGVPDPNVKLFNSQLNCELEKKISGRKIILSIGRLVPYKGFSLLIEAIKYLSEDTVIVIVGTGPLLTELQLAISNRGVQDRVLLVGKLSDSELRALFMCAKLYCLPSINRAEAFGVVLLEAMAYGLPIVASEISGSGVSWVNQHGVSGLNFPVGDAKALANSCNEILTSESFRTKLSHGARKRFLAEFTEELSVKRMLKIYDQLLAR